MDASLRLPSGAIAMAFQPLACAELPFRALAERGPLSPVGRPLRHARPGRVRQVDPPARKACCRRGRRRGRAHRSPRLDGFGVTGSSGGGAHALACAALLPDRVVRATCHVGVAPLGEPGLDREAWLARHGLRERQGVRVGRGRRGGSDAEARGGEREDRGSRRRKLRSRARRPRAERVRSCGARPRGDDAGRSRVVGRALDAWRRRLGRRRPCASEAVGFSRSMRSRSRSWSGTARRMWSSRLRTVSGWPRTSPGVSSRSTATPGTWAAIPRRRSRKTRAGCTTECRRREQPGRTSC